jgi:hypothetical protein
MDTKTSYKTIMRSYRIAYRTDIMSENGIAMRMQATSQVRAFTGKWDIPVPLWQSTFGSPFNKRKTLYKPSSAFRRFLKAN